MTENPADTSPNNHTDVDPTGLAAGRPAEGAMDMGGNEPIERPGLHHWRESTITDPDLNDRGGVFFAAIEMTRMPMILTDPNQPDNPIAFANKAFLDLTGYEEDEVLGLYASTNPALRLWTNWTGAACPSSSSQAGPKRSRRGTEIARSVTSPLATDRSLRPFVR